MKFMNLKLIFCRFSSTRKRSQTQKIAYSW